MHWAEFEVAAPELARLGRELFARDQVAMIGTIRKDGSPRISPAEPEIVDGRLYFGMIWRSFKALDLRRDPRCVVHALIHDRFASAGEFKLHGRASEIDDQDQRNRYADAIFARIGWRPAEPRFHLFAIEIHRAASFILAEDTRILTLWRSGEPVRKFRQSADGRLTPYP